MQKMRILAKSRIRRRIHLKVTCQKGQEQGDKTALRKFLFQLGLVLHDGLLKGYASSIEAHLGSSGLTRSLLALAITVFAAVSEFPIE